MKKALIAVLGVVTILIGLACEQNQKAATINDAITEATKADKPLLVDFYAEWCGPCKAFTKDSHEDADIMAALEKVVLHKVDCEKGEGIELAKEFEIRGYPTYILMNANKETIARWTGYGKDHFISTLTEELADISTIAEKQARFDENPSLNDALALARYSYSMDNNTDAVKYYRKAQELDPQADYSYDIFRNIATGLFRDAFTYEDAVRAAEKVYAGNDIQNQVYTSDRMAKIAEHLDKKDEYKKYLERGIDAAANSDDEDVKTYAVELKIDYNLDIVGDKAKAVELKKSTYEAGWTENANELNSFAWWCYENSVNLEEAEQLAIKATNLSEPGRAKAMILDTVAHICKSLGKNEDAIKYMEMAVNEDPEDEGWKTTLEEFKAELGEQPVS